jgi:hypothetical protein
MKLDIGRDPLREMAERAANERKIQRDYKFITQHGKTELWAKRKR